MHVKTKQALIIGALTIAFSVLAKAETVFCMSGKEVSAGEATRAAMSDPKAQVVKIQVSKVSFNEKTARLKKSDDLNLKAPCNIQ